MPRKFKSAQERRTHQSWADMRNRCNNPNNHAYARYGGRGIGCDPRWEHFSNDFLSDMWLKPDGMTLERVDNNLGYSPENCSCMRCEKPGYVQLARPDGRRGVWARAMGDEINICAGREGDDVFLSLKVGEVVGERHVKLFGEILQTYASRSGQPPQGSAPATPGGGTGSGTRT